VTFPRATYRLQLNRDFTFADAEAIVPYLDELGVSHVYLSPILMAQPGSTHGYDTIDHTRINPELGSIDDFRSLAGALQHRKMGIILDIVPNHMGIGGAENRLWLDVLKHGPKSRYADWFDIDWHPRRPGMDGKVLVPFLGTSYAEALGAGHIRLGWDEDGFAVWAYESQKLPIRPEDEGALLARYGSGEAAVSALNGAPGDGEGWAGLDSLIARQHWRLVHFSAAADEINYRRFFINSELAGIRVDRPDVFAHVHDLTFSLIAEGLVDGLRIDHIDGLLDPTGYLETLRQKVPRPIYLVVEKILAPHEPLPARWPVEGTTGYEVGAQLTRLLVQGGAEAAVTACYADFVGDVTEPEEEAYRSRLRIMDNELFAEIEGLAEAIARVAWSASATRGLTEAALRRALRETMAQMAVYRTYADREGLSPRDRREVGLAVARARRSAAQVQPACYDFLMLLLCRGLEAPHDLAAAGDAIARFQQLTGPVMAKGLEDTALYRYNRLVALNEVGAHPNRFSVSIDAFHDANRQRRDRLPATMIGTSTHDTKRGEDCRAMIASISDEPELWTEVAAEWRKQLQPVGAGDIHPNDLYLLFQLLLGGWPVHGDAGQLGERLKGAMVKSLREGRERSDWAVINSQYEGAVEQFIDRLLTHRPFLAQFHQTRVLLQEIGRRKSLIQTALKLTIPGVPDIYRGAEDWEQSFMDPDNRRSVDFGDLSRRLATPTSDADAKLILTQALLSVRRRDPLLFSEGSYESIDCGPTTLAFRRQRGITELALVADLSPGHRSGLSPMAGYTTIVGDSTGPVWVGLSGPVPKEGSDGAVRQSPIAGAPELAAR
jgi:(1->4)-alpha-D-glucan 1-alpha-D-glucosylmutase